MSVTTTMSHTWVKFTQTPVEVLADDQGQAVVFIDPDQVQVSEENSVYGCLVCEGEMNTVMGEECHGEA